MNVAPPRRIVILGGGTAGWMAAALLAHQWPREKCAVTLVESPDIGIIGVGEGSTPQLVAFMRQLGLREQEWMPRCNATYKAGIRFVGWSEAPGFESYFHPFATELDIHTLPAFIHHARLRRNGVDVPAHPDAFCLSERLAREGKTPLPQDNFPFAVGYGYHFDATLLGTVLREHAVEKLGVSHVPGTVERVEHAENGDIAALLLNDGQRIEGDFFIDASGFRALLIEQALGEQFISFGDVLFNDRAVAMPTPRAAGPLRTETRATALSAGWAWHIPLTNRIGNGYVYASAHCSPEQAEQELRAHLGPDADGAPARHLQMRVGRMRNSWHRNCLAIGLSQGFIEPLEATALHIVQATVEGFIQAWENADGLEKQRSAFNAEIGARYDGIRDYIVAHYRMNRRTDTDYWRANAANQAISQSLKALLHSWFTGGDVVREIERQNIARYYAPLSWHCLLGGYGQYPDPARLQPPAPGVAADLAHIDNFLARCARNFGNQTDVAEA